MARLIFILAILAVLIPSCNKEKRELVYGTVIADGTCGPNNWIVRLDFPEPSKQFFLCEEIAQFAGTNCNNSVVITDLPAELRVVGKRIKFRVDRTMPSCLSWSMAPKFVTVKSVSSAD